MRGLDLPDRGKVWTTRYTGARNLGAGAAASTSSLTSRSPEQKWVRFAIRGRAANPLAQCPRANTFSCAARDSVALGLTLFLVPLS